MNLVNFGEKANCKEMIFVQNREHAQKGKLLPFSVTVSRLVPEALQGS